jgi:hypothetical protein
MSNERSDGYPTYHRKQLCLLCDTLVKETELSRQLLRYVYSLGVCLPMTCLNILSPAPILIQ